MLKKIKISGLSQITPLNIEQVPEGKYWYVADISTGYYAEDMEGVPTENPFVHPIEPYYTDWDFTGNIYENTSRLYNDDHSINDRYSKKLTKGTYLAEGSSILSHLNVYHLPPSWISNWFAPYSTTISVFEFDNE